MRNIPEGISIRRVGSRVGRQIEIGPLGRGVKSLMKTN